MCVLLLLMCVYLMMMINDDDDIYLLFHLFICYLCLLHLFIYIYDDSILCVVPCAFLHSTYIVIPHTFLPLPYCATTGIYSHCYCIYLFDIFALATPHCLTHIPIPIPTLPCTFLKWSPPLPSPSPSPHHTSHAHFTLHTFCYDYTGSHVCLLHTLLPATQFYTTLHCCCYIVHTNSAHFLPDCTHCVVHDLPFTYTATRYCFFCRFWVRFRSLCCDCLPVGLWVYITTLPFEALQHLHTFLYIPLYIPITLLQLFVHLVPVVCAPPHFTVLPYGFGRILLLLHTYLSVPHIHAPSFACLFFFFFFVMMYCSAGGCVACPLMVYTMCVY